MKSFAAVIAAFLENRSSRSNLGADLVLSSATMGANTIYNLVREDDNLLLAEGVLVFPSPVPKAMAGKRLMDCAVRTLTGCTVIAVERDGKQVVNPDPEIVLPKDGMLLLIGTLEAEEKFLRELKPDLAPDSLRRRLLRKKATS
jgi:voltage-gated potassium channel